MRHWSRPGAIGWAIRRPRYRRRAARFGSRLQQPNRRVERSPEYLAAVERRGLDLAVLDFQDIPRRQHPRRGYIHRLCGPVAFHQEGGYAKAIQSVGMKLPDRMIFRKGPPKMQGLGKMLPDLFQQAQLSRAERGAASASIAVDRALQPVNKIEAD